MLIFIIISNDLKKSSILNQKIYFNNKIKKLYKLEKI